MVQFRNVGAARLSAMQREATLAGVQQAAEDLVAQARADTPVRTGTLQASIHHEGTVVSAAAIMAKVATGGEANDYAVFVHEGTGAHIIRPRSAKVLAFNGTFATVVHHPGTRATKFLERPLLANAGLYRELIRRAAASAF